MSSSSLSIIAFLSSTFLVVLQKRSKNKKKKDDSPILMDKKTVIELREKHFLKSVSVSYANSGPLLIVGGHESRLIDEQGTTYLDTRNNVAHVGHGNRYVVKAVQKQLSILNTNTRYLHPNVVTLAKRLTEKLPDPLEVVIFVNSGSEANDLALRLARAYTKSQNTIVVDRAYHGHTLATLEISPYKFEHSKEYSLTTTNGEYATPGHHIWKVPCPDTYRGKHRDSTNAGTLYAKYVQDACKFYTGKGESVGAFVIEGGMSVAGVILPPADYLLKSVEAVRASGGVYIADEVQTGFGRLGCCYWAFQYGNHNVVPDIVTVGKPFGNGMPLGAVITTKEVAQGFEAMGVEYFNTFGGSPVCAAAGNAVLDILEANMLQQHAIEVGDHLKSLFLQLKDRLDIIGDVRGSGLFIGIELVRNHSTLEPATEETSVICTKLKENYHILTSIDGAYDNVLVVKPPLVFSKADAAYFVDSFEKASYAVLALGDEVLKMKKTPT